MFLYRDIFKKSFFITWKHKQLWFFGIFAALLSGFNQCSMSMKSMSEDWNSSIFSATSFFYSKVIATGSFWAKLASVFQRDPVHALIFTAFMLVLLAIFLFLLWLAVISQAGLINNGARILVGGKNETNTIGGGLKAGMKNFWPVLTFDIIAAGLISFFSILVGLPLIFLTIQADFSLYLLYVLLFVLFIPLALIVSFLAKYAICFVVLKGERFVDAFVEAYRLFEKNWLISIEVALIVFMIEFIFIVAIGLLFLILAIPYIFLAKALSLAIIMVLGINSFFPWAIIVGLILAIILLALCGAVLTVFKTVVWTDVFVRLVDKKGGLSKIVRLAARLRK
jgi:hypothetical protein